MAILHVIKPVQTRYILVHPVMYYYCFFVQVHTGTYSHDTGTYQYIPVCTKNPDFVLLVGIPDDYWLVLAVIGYYYNPIIDIWVTIIVINVSIIAINFFIIGN
jgi:hypothetical protein